MSPLEQLPDDRVPTTAVDVRTAWVFDKFGDLAVHRAEVWPDGHGWWIAKYGSGVHVCRRSELHDTPDAAVRYARAYLEDLRARVDKALEALG